MLPHIFWNGWKKNILQCANTYQRIKTVNVFSAADSLWEQYKPKCSSADDFICVIWLWKWKWREFSSSIRWKSRLQTVHRSYKQPFPSFDGEVNQASRLHTPLSSLPHCGHEPESASEPRRGELKELINTHTVHTLSFSMMKGIFVKWKSLGYSLNTKTANETVFKGWSSHGIIQYWLLLLK